MKFGDRDSEIDRKEIEQNLDLNNKAQEDAKMENEEAPAQKTDPASSQAPKMSQIEQDTKNLLDTEVVNSKVKDQWVLRLGRVKADYSKI